MTQMYFGTITAAIPPDDQFNISKTQYEYDVMVVGDRQCLIPVKHVIRIDAFGSDDEYDDSPLRPGSRVVVMFRDSSLTSGLIIGGIRMSKTVMPKEEGVYRRTRFNETEQTVSRQGGWRIKTDQGDRIGVDKEKIYLDNDHGESITIDRESQTITVKAGKDWVTELKGEMKVTASGDVTISCQNAVVKTKGDAKVESTGDVKVKAANVNVEATVKATVKAATVDVKADAKAVVKAPIIELGNGGGQVLTTLTSPLVDNITGQPSIGVPTITAG